MQTAAEDGGAPGRPDHTRRRPGLWQSLPDGVFRAAGAAVFLGYFAIQAWNYAGHWPHLGYFYQIDPAAARVPRALDWLSRAGVAPRFDAPPLMRYELPWVQVLVDLTFLTIGWGYCVRVRPLQRAAGAARVTLPFVAALWPLAPHLAQAGATLLADAAGRAADNPARRILGDVRLGPGAYLLGCGLIAAGNALDVWSYAALRRSVSIVAEARELVTRGPYRWIRHPVYLGQFIAQFAIYVVFRSLHLFWTPYYVAFVALQLYRARVEERVLEEAFGEVYARYRRRTFWFTH